MDGQFQPFTWPHGNRPTELAVFEQVKNVNNLSFLIGLLFLATGEPPDDYTGTKFDLNDLDI